MDVHQPDPGPPSRLRALLDHFAVIEDTRQPHRVLPSSKRCACCGAVNAGLALGERSWTCPCCGTVLERDGNAADNLRRLGLAAVEDGPVPDEFRA